MQSLIRADTVYWYPTDPEHLNFCKFICTFFFFPVFFLTKINTYLFSQHLPNAPDDGTWYQVLENRQINMRFACKNHIVWCQLTQRITARKGVLRSCSALASYLTHGQTKDKEDKVFAVTEGIEQSLSSHPVPHLVPLHWIYLDSTHTVCSNRHHLPGYYF